MTRSQSMLAALAIFINLVGHVVTGRFALPIDLNALGTAGAAATGGTPTTIMTVVITIVIVDLVDSRVPIVSFTVVQALFASAAIIARRYGWFSSSTVVPIAVFVGLVSGMLSVGWTLVSSNASTDAGPVSLIGAGVGGLLQIAEAVIVFGAVGLCVRFLPTSGATGAKEA